MGVYCMGFRHARYKAMRVLLAMEVTLLLIFVKRIIDWKRVYIQSLLMMGIGLIGCIYNWPKILKDTIEGAEVSVSELPFIWKFAVGAGRWIFVCFVLVFAYILIRKLNKDYVLRQTFPNATVWHPYIGYWYCRNIMGIKKVSLVRVPIPLQFKLVWKGIFDSYDEMDGVIEQGEPDDVRITVDLSVPYTSRINLILADTYPIDDWKEKLPQEVHGFKTIIIDRSTDYNDRVFSRKYISEIRKVVHSLPPIASSINVFATTNAAHVFHIAKDVFMNGGRDGEKHLRVYQQSSGSWAFKGKNVKIF